MYCIECHIFACFTNGIGDRSKILGDNKRKYAAIETGVVDRETTSKETYKYGVMSCFHLEHALSYPYEYE